MIECITARKNDQLVLRHAIQHDLMGALDALFSIYGEVGVGSPQAIAGLDARIETTAGHQGDRPTSQRRVHTLYRARDFHRFATKEPSETTFRIRFLELALLSTNAENRWAAQRGLLLEHLSEICRVPYTGWSNNLEIYKREISHPGSAVGQIIVAAALINLDAGEEQPPDNMVLRFRSGRFPEHYWELVPKVGRASNQVAVGDWPPQTPLNRWSYLAADLLSAVCQRAAAERGGAQRNLGGTEALLEGKKQGEMVYIRWQEAEGDKLSAQLELLPLEQGRLTQEVHRAVFRRFGGEGIRLLALLLLKLDASTGNPLVELDLVALAKRASLPGDTGRVRRERIVRLKKVIELLGTLQVVRRQASEGVSEPGPLEKSTEVESRRSLIQIVGDILPSGSKTEDKIKSGGEVSTESLLILMDPILLLAEGESMVAPYQGLPERLWELAPRDYPYVLPLYAMLAGRIAAGVPLGWIEGSAAGLLESAGVWVSPSGKYKAVEAFKSALGILKDCGCLLGWKLTAQAAGVLEQSYRLELPRGGTANSRGMIAREGNEVKEDGALGQEAQAVRVSI